VIESNDRFLMTGVLVGDDMKLSKHLCKDCVKFGVHADNCNDLFSFLAQEAEEAGLVINKRSFFEGLFKRESEMSTGVGKGLAVPHVQVSGAKETFVMSAVLDSPLDFDALDKVPVDVVFVIGGKPGEVGLHLQLLARLARLAREPGFLSRLKEQKTNKNFVNVIEECEKTLWGN
jgi:mannitol/fructose-specific phosphotransferase system IIA component (Ntr-type)